MSSNQPTTSSSKWTMRNTQRSNIFKNAINGTDNLTDVRKGIYPSITPEKGIPEDVYGKKIIEKNEQLAERAFELGLQDGTNGNENRFESNTASLDKDLKENPTAKTYYNKGYNLAAKQNQFKAVFPKAKGGKTRKNKKHSKKTMKKKVKKSRK